MKVTIPHMGNVYIATRALFEGLGVDYVIPPQNSKAALEIGSLHAPEEICLPFKIMVGNYVQAIEQGADTVIVTGSCGPCRFGEYCEMHMKLLKRLGHQVEFIVVDAPKAIGLKELMARISRLTGSSPRSKGQKWHALAQAVRIMRLLDTIEAKAHERAGYEKVRGSCKHLLRECRQEVYRCKAPEKMIKCLHDYNKRMDEIPCDNSARPVRIAIIGEIYTVIEPFSNLYIEDKLMDYGISTKRLMTPSWWVGNTLMSPTRLNSLSIKKASRDYLPYNIGGHARECVGEAILSWKSGFDGAIQIFPMGCMPEIVSKAILPTIARDKDFPILSLVVDEMTGEAGYITRIEAFVDMLERRRSHAVSGY